MKTKKHSAPSKDKLKSTFSSKASTEYFIVSILFLILSYFYLYPGSLFLFQGRTDLVLSDGTDQLAAPYMFHLLIERFKTNPFEFIYGTGYSNLVNPPNGFLVWHSWIEKIWILLLSLITPLEQINAAIAYSFITLNGLLMYALTRYLKWGRLLALGLSLSWAYNAFTLARAKVHPGLEAIFFIPLLFIAFKLIKNKYTTKNIAIAAGLILIVATMPQYFILITAFLSPFWLCYIFYNSESKIDDLKKIIWVVLPSMLLLIWTLAMPTSLEIKNRLTEIYPVTGQSQQEIHPFLFQFAADPIDYLSGNIGITLNDWNPLKEDINNQIYAELPAKGSNSHEHAVGIRWVLLLLALFPAYFLLTKKKFFVENEKSELLFFYSLGVFAFLLSLSPQIFGYNIGPSLWLHKLVSQVRVPSRAGIFVHFSVLMLVGIFLNRLFNTNTLKPPKRTLLQIAFPILIILELPPIYELPINQILPSVKILESGNCGVGMYFPVVNGGYDMITYYRLLQTMRHSNCVLLNSISMMPERDPLLLNKFARHPTIVDAIKNNNSTLEDDLIKFSQCVPLEWIYFDNTVPSPWRQHLCDRLGWQMSDGLVCHNIFNNTKIINLPEDCIKRL